MPDTTYNGWKNHATWLANLHLDNTYAMSDELLERAGVLIDENDGSNAEACYALADEIKAFIESALEDWMPAQQGLGADLVNGYLSEVDWDEIALHYVADACFQK